MRINQPSRELPRKMPHTALVSSEGLKDKDDKVRFEADSYREFGQRYAEADSKRALACLKARSGLRSLAL